MIYEYRSIKPNYMTQDIGEEKACVKEQNGYPVYPLKPTGGHTSCPTGYMGLYKALGIKKGHNGRDWAAPVGTGILHSRSFNGWTKNEVDHDGGLGIDVISHEPLLTCTDGCLNTKHYIKARYWHCSELPTFDNSHVEMGSFLALSGNTGLSSGPHVHDALKWCDKEGNGLHSDNGLYGVIDTNKHHEVKFENKYVLDVVEEEKRKIASVKLEENMIKQGNELVRALKLLVFNITMFLLQARSKANNK